MALELSRSFKCDCPEYEYGPGGNRTVLETANGRTIYEYDALNRLVRVIAPDGSITIFQYDAVGNRIGVTNPNGTVTSYVYDSLNRLLYLENRKSDGTIINSYAYTLGPSGNRLSVEEHNDRRVDYAYDALYRLVAETITDSIHGNETITFTLDAVGNRLAKTDGTGTIAYSYDDNDRLLMAGSDSFAYDANGNTLAATVDGQTTTYSYDFENRLVDANTPTAPLGYSYSPDGIRVSSEIDGIVTTYLVDENRAYAEVVEEHDATGLVTAFYLHADDLISQERNGQVYTNHQDGRGSITDLPLPLKRLPAMTAAGPDYSNPLLLISR